MLNIKHTLQVLSNKVFKKRVFYPPHSTQARFQAGNSPLSRNAPASSGK